MPAAFSATAFQARIAKMSSSQKDVQSVSKWVAARWQSADECARLWRETLERAPLKRKMLLLYLANDVIQQRRSRGVDVDAVKRAFAPELPAALRHIVKRSDIATVAKAKRVALIWRDRRCLPAHTLSLVFEVFPGGAAAAGRRPPSPPEQAPG